MSSPEVRLTTAGKLVLNVVAAAVIFFVFQLFPEFPFNWLVALVVLAVISSVLDTSIFSLPNLGGKASAGGSVEGSVKWFNGTKGFGFITADNGDEVFLHFKNLDGINKRQVKPGMRVSFTVVEGDRGPQAENVTEA